MDLSLFFSIFFRTFAAFDFNAFLWPSFLSCAAGRWDERRVTAAASFCGRGRAGRCASTALERPSRRAACATPRLSQAADEARRPCVAPAEPRHSVAYQSERAARRVHLLWKRTSCLQVCSASFGVDFSACLLTEKQTKERSGKRECTAKRAFLPTSF